MMTLSGGLGEHNNGKNESALTAKGPGNKPTVRFDLKLDESNETECAEVNYSELYRKSCKKQFPGECHDDLSLLDPFDSKERKMEEERIAAIVQTLEAKYGGSTGNKPNKKRSKKFRKKIVDLMDLGMGYDDSDSFIDNTEAYDELVPSTLTTKLGGFYINSGTLEFKEVASATSSDSELDAENHENGFASDTEEPFIIETLQFQAAATGDQQKMTSSHKAKRHHHKHHKKQHPQHENNNLDNLNKNDNNNNNTGNRKHKNNNSNSPYLNNHKKKKLQGPPTPKTESTRGLSNNLAHRKIVTDSDIEIIEDNNDAGNETKKLSNNMVLHEHEITANLSSNPIAHHVETSRASSHKHQSSSATKKYKQYSPLKLVKHGPVKHSGSPGGNHKKKKHHITTTADHTNNKVKQGFNQTPSAQKLVSPERKAIEMASNASPNNTSLNKSTSVRILPNLTISTGSSQTVLAAKISKKLIKKSSNAALNANKLTGGTNISKDTRKQTFGAKDAMGFYEHFTPQLKSLIDQIIQISTNLKASSSPIQPNTPSANDSSNNAGPNTPTLTQNSSNNALSRFFTPHVNSLLLALENESRTSLSNSQRSKLYDIIEIYVPCSRETLLRRAKRVWLDDREHKLVTAIVGFRDEFTLPDAQLKNNETALQYLRDIIHLKLDMWERERHSSVSNTNNQTAYYDPHTHLSQFLDSRLKPYLKSDDYEYLKHFVRPMVDTFKAVFVTNRKTKKHGTSIQRQNKREEQLTVSQDNKNSPQQVYLYAETAIPFSKSNKNNDNINNVESRKNNNLNLSKPLQTGMQNALVADDLLINKKVIDDNNRSNVGGKRKIKPIPITTLTSPQDNSFSTTLTKTHQSALTSNTDITKHALPDPKIELSSIKPQTASVSSISHETKMVNSHFSTQSTSITNASCNANSVAPVRVYNAQAQNITINQPHVKRKMEDSIMAPKVQHTHSSGSEKGSKSKKQDLKHTPLPSPNNNDTTVKTNKVEAAKLRQSSDEYLESLTRMMLGTIPPVPPNLIPSEFLKDSKNSKPSPTAKTLQQRNSSPNNFQKKDQNKYDIGNTTPNVSQELFENFLQLAKDPPKSQGSQKVAKNKDMQELTLQQQQFELFASNFSQTGAAPIPPPLNSEEFFKMISGFALHDRDRKNTKLRNMPVTMANKSPPSQKFVTVPNSKPIAQPSKATLINYNPAKVSASSQDFTPKQYLLNSPSQNLPKVAASRDQQQYLVDYPTQDISNFISQTIRTKLQQQDDSAHGKRKETSLLSKPDSMPTSCSSLTFSKPHASIHASYSTKPIVSNVPFIPKSDSFSFKNIQPTSNEFSAKLHPSDSRNISANAKSTKHTTLGQQPQSSVTSSFPSTKTTKASLPTNTQMIRPHVAPNLPSTFPYWPPPSNLAMFEQFLRDVASNPRLNTTTTPLYGPPSSMILPYAAMPNPALPRFSSNENHYPINLHHITSTLQTNSNNYNIATHTSSTQPFLKNINSFLTHQGTNTFIPPINQIPPLLQNSQTNFNNLDNKKNKKERIKLSSDIITLDD